jgi:non-specific serine/threonine protein kinase
MAILTPQLLDSYPYSHYADARSIQRGRAYYKEGRVWDVDLINKNKAICLVDGDSGEYTVEIEADKKSGSLYFDCDCPYAEDHFCKHMIAAALALCEHLKSGGEAGDEEGGFLDYEDDDKDVAIPPASHPTNNRYFPPATHQRVTSFYHPPAPPWRQQLENALQQVPRTASAGANVQRYAAVVLLTKEYYYSPGAYSLKPYIIRARDWRILQSMVEADKQAVADLLDQNLEWIKVAEEMRDNANPAGCLNLSGEAISLINFLFQLSRYYYSGLSGIVSYLPMLAHLDIPLYLAVNKQKIQNRVQIIPEPVEFEITFTHEQGSYNLQAALKNQAFAVGKSKVETISFNPPWVLMDNLLFPLQNSSHIVLLSSFPISIPESEAEFFRENYLRRVAETFPINSDLIRWRNVQAEPIPRLYLHDDKDQTLRADLRFGYGDYEVNASKTGTMQSVETLPDSWELIRVYRHPDREQYFYQLLTDPNYRLKRAGTSQPFGAFELRARAHPFDFLLHSIPLLTQAGFEIYGEEKLKLGKINRATPMLRLSITSGIDWFDLKTLVEFGDQQISLHDVHKALKRGEHYVKLADGSVGKIPEEWLEKYKHLWNLAQETTDGFRVADVHLSLLDSLLEDDASIQTPPDLIQRRERLRSFERIEHHPLPSGFVGELRPYQKHGFDWLHFLREYKLGGVLADDMGLGKTVQVLTLLQSLKEQGEASTARSIKKATLLVVPKSLLTNWQRESEKFTPALRFLEYMGNFRAKDTAIFDDFDVVLTTYGTMLRDVELLRAYKFHYIILDESQAIKNPLAKSAKAARLLTADHRLVMTGTPVENNTFELWSQFAFLNPGLLGNMDYFKSAFANPIEAKGDEAAAKTLRKLVYPFILRRTKEQVAPELPPRTERIVYAAMDAAQKKLYIQTRERYRAELLGLIESEGIPEARFKILEGLLRLRQIAIHPALVDSNYRGEAPKFEILLETLETLQAERHKALVFSQFVETLKLVRRELDERKIKYVYLDGQTPNRQSRVDLFQNDPKYPFFLISLKAGGVGLNLTAADYVIHLDPWWNPAVEIQASDRAHRIGQDKPVFVYKIITRDTVEEKILQLQEKKRALVTSLITTEASFFKSLTQDNIKELFS